MVPTHFTRAPEGYITSPWIFLRTCPSPAKQGAGILWFRVWVCDPDCMVQPQTSAFPLNGQEKEQVVFVQKAWESRICLFQEPRKGGF